MKFVMASFSSEYQEDCLFKLQLSFLPTNNNWGVRLGDSSVQILFENFLLLNAQHSSIMETRAVFSSIILSEVAAENLIII